MTQVKINYMVKKHKKCEGKVTITGLGHLRCVKCNKIIQLNNVDFYATTTRDFEKVKSDLKADFMKRGWQTDVYYAVFNVVMDFIKTRIYYEPKRNVESSYLNYFRCKKCGMKRARYRKRPKNYLCRMCKHIFK